MKFLSSTKFLIILMALSALVIAVGLWMVQRALDQQPLSPAAASGQAASQSIGATEQDEQVQLQQIAEEAEALLRESIQPPEGPVALELSREHQAELQARFKDAIPEVGSADWCEYMMIKPNAEWTDIDKGHFARNCI